MISCVFLCGDKLTDVVEWRIIPAQNRSSLFSLFRLRFDYVCLHWFASFCPPNRIWTEFCTSRISGHESQNGANTALWGIAGRKNHMIKILFVCHGSILRSLEKACYINGFHRSDGAYYTTITPFVEELWCDNPKLHILNKMKRTYPRCRICPLHFYLRFFLPFPCCNCGRAFPRWLIGLFKYLDSLSISISETNCSLVSLS